MINGIKPDYLKTHTFETAMSNFLTTLEDNTREFYSSTRAYGDHTITYQTGIGGRRFKKVESVAVL